MIEYVKFDGKILAIIIRSTFSKECIEFFTPEHFSQQLGYMICPNTQRMSTGFMEQY